MTQRVVLPIRHGDVLLGFLWVIVGDRPLTDADRAAIARGGAEVADNLWGRLREADERRDPHQRAARPGVRRGAGGRRPGRDPALAGDRELRRRRLRRRRRDRRAPAPAPRRRRLRLAGAGRPRRHPRPRPARRPWPTSSPRPAPAAASARAVAGLADTAEALRQADIAALCARAAPGRSARRRLRASSAAGRLIATLWIAAGRPLPLVAAARADHAPPQRPALRGPRRLLEHGGDVAAAAQGPAPAPRHALPPHPTRRGRSPAWTSAAGDDRLLAHLGLRLLRLHEARTYSGTPSTRDICRVKGQTP